MTRKEKREQIENLKCSANSPKDRLMSIWEKLLEMGATKDARRLESIIARLEYWQNT